MLNKEKSSLTLSQHLEFMGALLVARVAREFLPRNRFVAIVELVSKLTCFPMTTARVCSRLLGHMEVNTYVVCHTRMRLRLLQAWLVKAFDQSRGLWDMVLMLPSAVIASLHWWTQEAVVCSGVPFTVLPPSVMLVTDASDLGWGAHLGLTGPRACGPL